MSFSLRLALLALAARGPDLAGHVDLGLIQQPVGLGQPFAAGVRVGLRERLEDVVERGDLRLQLRQFVFHLRDARFELADAPVAFEPLLVLSDGERAPILLDLLAEGVCGALSPLLGVALNLE
ncbi:MAG: hypothetical protein ACK4WM_05715 [Thermoflexales bacterium]